MAAADVAGTPIEQLETELEDSDLDFVDEEIYRLEPQVKRNDDLNNIVVVDNLPIAKDATKIAKLTVVLKKIFGNQKIGALTDPGIILPTNEAGHTLGYAFVVYAVPEAADRAVEKLNGYLLPKTHVFAVNKFSDFEKLAAVPAEYEAPEAKDYVERENLKWWLLNAKSDQFVTRYQDETEVLNHAAGRKPESVYKRQRWTDTYVRWSPQGSYLATFHQLGIMLWGGESWGKLVRLPHKGVKLIDFSPCERYIVSLSDQYQDKDDPADPNFVCVWDVKSGKKLRGFEYDKSQARVWPLFKWSPDGNFLARQGEDKISVFQTPEMGLLDKKSLAIPHIKDFCWSPTDNVISAWVPEFADNPARVILTEIPSRKEIRQKTLYHVSSCEMHWQAHGDYLCVKVDRHTKSKKTTYVNFELFSIRVKEIPVESFEMKDQINAFAWEPNGSRFAIIHSDGGPRPHVTIWDLTREKLEKLVTLEKRPASHLFWSPIGTTLVVAGFKNLNGALEFYNVDTQTTMSNQEHCLATELHWEPSGRSCATVASAWVHPQLENGYNIWTYTGKLQHKHISNSFYQLLWRPRPKSLLTEEQKADIKKNVRQYAAKYRAEDMTEQDAAKIKERAARSSQLESFHALLDEMRAQRAREKPQRISIRGGQDSDDEGVWAYRMEMVEEVVEEAEEVEEDEVGVEAPPPSLPSVVPAAAPFFFLFPFLFAFAAAFDWLVGSRAGAFGPRVAWSNS
eukprot:TRINITY_DN8995_c0_g1_i1.p1 TRINITY_DN8995_c0_g1~~TRINITY_DN8995_c0_g1_i1.p1  ORF type:complete len:736 (+),score=233.59 TRINITY_DN8995_c0_g1_i1:187-2394(+)